MTGYYQTDFRGHPLFQCERCELDSLDEQRLIDHMRTNRCGEPRSKYAPGDFAGYDITLGYLTWNEGEIACRAVKALIDECNRLTTAGANARIVWVDNGSNDHTKSQVRMILNKHTANTRRKENPDNRGQSAARNQIIRTAQEYNSDYVTFVDGDVVVVPYSLMAMVEYCELHSDRKIGCLGANSVNFSSSVDDPRLVDHAFAITDQDVKVRPRIAWTQYGVFNMKPFAENVLFDTSPCFQGPGWGFEDDDLALQLQDLGYDCLNTNIRYAHPRNSSLRQIDHTLAAKVFDDRKRYLMAKWGQKANYLDSQTMPLTNQG